MYKDPDHHHASCATGFGRAFRTARGTMSIARAVRVPKRVWGPILERLRSEPGHRRTCQISAALIVLALLSLFASYHEGRVLGQDNRMYSPPYRWRQSLVIALSRLLPDDPSRRYSGYSSIENYFTENGLALFEHERGFDPAAPQRWLKIQADGNRLNEMIAHALKVPIDHALPPALLYANELGSVDYVHLAFRLFGPTVDSLYKLYYLLLAFSCALFVVQFRRSPGRLFLLCAYLAAHYFMITVYIPNSLWQLATVHNSRFFSALGLLPALHLICIALAPKEPLTRMTLATATGQAALLGFLTLCRLEVIWELAAVTFAGLFALA